MYAIDGGFLKTFDAGGKEDSVEAGRLLVEPDFNNPEGIIC